MSWVSVREALNLLNLTKKAEGQGAGGRGKEGNTLGAKWFQAPGFIHGEEAGGRGRGAGGKTGILLPAPCSLPPARKPLLDSSGVNIGSVSGFGGLTVRLTMNLCKSGQPLNTPLVDCGKQLFR